MSKVKLQREFLRHFQEDLAIDSKSHFVATADLALISHLKDDFGTTKIRNFPGVLNISVFTGGKTKEVKDYVIDKTIIFIEERKDRKHFSIIPLISKSKTLPCIVRVNYKDELLADFLLTTVKWDSSRVDRPLSKKLGYSVKRLDLVI